ncbi:family 20 glycosylhydrolase [Neisseria sp. CCUG12390]|uniref:family 20 glycosylhydrolase n=1 Tax=Neisseria sp. CCUG12390 TaxID=3392035 RepID=UPI003A103172
MKPVRLNTSEPFAKEASKKQGQKNLRETVVSDKEAALLLLQEKNEENIVSDGLVQEDNPSVVFSDEIPLPQWIDDATLAEPAQYPQTAQNSHAGVYAPAGSLKDAVPEDEYVKAEEIARDTPKLPYILAGSGLLLAGLALAAGKGSGGGSKKQPAAPVPETESEGMAGAGSPAENTENIKTQPAVPIESKPVQAGRVVPEKTVEKPVRPSEEKTTSGLPLSGTASAGKQPERVQEAPDTRPKPSEAAPSPTNENKDNASDAVLPAPPVSDNPRPEVKNTEPAKQSGLTLDIARHFYSAAVIKKYIDVISAEGGTFLHLHLSDDENYAFESRVLNQLSENGIRNPDGSYTNPATGKRFLSFAQIADIAAYAKAKGVELVPEVDSPSHMQGIFDLLEIHRGSDYLRQIKSDVVDDEIDINDPEAVGLVQSLYTEVIGLINGGSRHFHIGGDEFGYSVQSNPEFIAYANKMAAFLKERGLTPRMWNDGLLKNGLTALDKDIEITYWSYDGNPGDAATAAQRRAERATMEDLLDNGFDVLNYNWYYLYFVPDDGVTNAQSGAHMASDIQSKWELGLWDGTSSNKIEDTDNIIGASLTIWGEDADNMSDQQIFEYSAPGLTALISKMNALSADTGALSEYALEITADTAFNETVELGSQSANLVEVSMTDDILQNGNSFVWLNGSSDDRVALDSAWAADGASALKDNVSYTLYKSGQNHLYIDTDIPVMQV